MTTDGAGKNIFAGHLVSFPNIAYNARHATIPVVQIQVETVSKSYSIRCFIMAEIKSTLEKVMERAASMGRANQEEIQAEERVKEGMRLAADYLQGREVDFGAALAGPGTGAVKKGIVQVFLRNITLPRDEDGERAEKSMQGLLELGQGSGDLASIFRDMKGILDHYRQHQKEIRQQLEDAFRQQMEHALAQQTGKKGLGMKMDPRLHPKFQEEWSRVKSDLDSQYNKVLQQHKDLVAQRFSVTI
jgi:hypothetical protein